MQSNSPSVSIRAIQLIAIALMLLMGLACSDASGQSGKVKVIASQDTGYKLEVYDNSDTFSQIVAINSTGQMIGVREIMDETKTIYSQQCFFIDGTKQKILPLLEGYTNVEVQALSDNGLAVGFASRPLGHPDGSLTAIVWDIPNDKVTNLGALPGDGASQAQDICADGTRITGYSTGFAPSRMRPCVWNWKADTKTWEAETLPVIEQNNPFLMSSAVLISPDGQKIAACITVEVLSAFAFDSSLFIWEREADQWTRKPLSDDQVHLKDMNNAGGMAAVYTANGVRIPVYVNPEGDITQIELLKNDVSGEALGINAQAVVVGLSDDPPGPDGGPQAFVFRDGKTTPLLLPEATTASAALAINDSGQIAGLVDVSMPNREKSAGDNEDTTFTTLAFRWTPESDKPTSAKQAK